MYSSFLDYFKGIKKIPSSEIIICLPRPTTTPEPEIATNVQ